MPDRYSQSSSSGMFIRYVLFVTLSMLILAINAYIHAPRPRPSVSPPVSSREEPTAVAQADSQKDVGAPVTGAPEVGQAMDQAEGAVAEGTSPPQLPSEAASLAEDSAPEEPEPPLRFVTLGSLDPQSPYRMLVTLSNRGAGVIRIELNDRRYRATEVRHGYLGHLAGDDETAVDGCIVQVVGPGTPAEKAGLQPGDEIIALNDQPVGSWPQLNSRLRYTRPGQTVRLKVRRGEKVEETSVRLGRQPVEVIRPEWGAHASFLLTLESVDEHRLENQRRQLQELQDRAQRLRARVRESRNDPGALSRLAEQIRALEEEIDHVLGNPSVGEVRYQFAAATAAERVLDSLLQRVDIALVSTLELPKVGLRRLCWEITEATPDFVRFRRRLPSYGLEVEKIYQLAQVPGNERQTRSYPAYHLTLRLVVRNLWDRPRRVAYQLDGPNGLPTEGHWYAVKVGPGWGAYGLRDIAVAWEGGRWDLISCWRIAEGRPPLWREEHGQRIRYVGVDAQYFSVILLPQRSAPAAEWYYAAQPIRVGMVPHDRKNLTNTSCRLTTVEFPITADGGELVHEYQIFAGPKSPPLLSHYGLRNLVVYGWFWWVAIPMLWILHFLHDYVLFNYGLAIIALTVLVRLAMFPLSWKQALAAQKMQQIQPELRRIYEKYKNDPQQRLRAQQELFRKYNYNPLGGCLILLLQLPIFIGLYRALMVDVELRAAPLITDAIRWCSDLSAPDMLLDWSRFWSAIGWHWFNEGYGMFALGPYFNILPVLTIALFIWQQKALTPPPADEQAAMQQKVMTFMLIFMGILFYKVASGLCIYFIASSLWGLAERQFLPKIVPPREEAEPPVVKKSPPSKGKSWLEQLRSRLEVLSEEKERKKPTGAFGSRQLRRMLSKKSRKGQQP